MASNDSPAAKFHILIVDDDRLVRSALTRTLARNPTLEIHEFPDAEPALARAGEIRFAVAILDLQMPVIDGAELGARLRVLQPDLPLVFVSANITSEIAARARALPANAMIAKPWSPSELTTLIVSFCTAETA